MQTVSRIDRCLEVVEIHDTRTQEAYQKWLAAGKADNIRGQEYWWGRYIHHKKQAQLWYDRAAGII